MAAKGRKKSRAAESRRIAREIIRLREMLKPRLPGVDEQDMVMILHAMLQKTDRIFFLRELRPGVHVF